MCSAVGDKKLIKTMLAKLIESGSHAEIESLIVNEPSQHLADSNGTTLLHLASKYNNLKMIEFLIDFGCDVNVENSSGMTPLMFAVISDRLEATKLLLENNANIFAVNSDKQNVLSMLGKSKISAKLPLLKCFIDKMKNNGFKISDIAKSLESANFTLSEIVCMQNSQLTKAFLQQNSFDLVDSYQSMHNAMVTFKMKQVRTLLTHGPFFKKRRMYFLRCILSVATKSKPETLASIETFATQILHWNTLSNKEFSMLEYTLKKANKESVKIILQSGIISHVKKCNNRDVFVHIFGNANPGIIDLMNNVEFDVNARGFNGQTALHIAVQNKLAKNVSFLLKRGANPNTCDDKGETPMFQALWTSKNPNDSVKCVELLLLHGADVQACDYNGGSFIYYAAGTTCNITANLLELALTYLVLREAKGLPIEQFIYDQIDLRDLSRNLFIICRDKFEGIKDRKICDKLTIFSMITENMENLCRRVNMNDCKIIANLIDREQNISRFYHNILRHRLIRIVKTHNLKGRAKIVIFDSIEVLQGYDVVIEKIISFFNHEDLILFE